MLDTGFVDVARWNEDVERLDVPQRPKGQSESLLERCLDASVEKWSRQRSAYHRLRYMALITRPFKVASAQRIQRRPKRVMFIDSVLGTR